MQKEKRKVDKNRIIENVMVMLLGSMIISLLFLFYVFSFSPNILRTIVDVDRVASFTSDDYVVSVVRLCELPDDNLDKFLCVSEFFDLVYDFNHTKGIKSPGEMFETGGDCLDSSYFFCSVFTSIDGFECQVVHLNNINHALSVVTFDDKYCIVDQDYFQCVLVGGSEEIEDDDITYSYTYIDYGCDKIEEQDIKI